MWSLIKILGYDITCVMIFFSHIVLIYRKITLSQFKPNYLTSKIGLPLWTDSYLQGIQFRILNNKLLWEKPKWHSLCKKLPLFLPTISFESQIKNHHCALNRQKDNIITFILTTWNRNTYLYYYNSIFNNNLGPSPVYLIQIKW